MPVENKNNTEAETNAKNDEEDLRPFLAPCRQLPLSAPLKWIKQGWQDIKRAPKQSLSYGVILLLISYLITAGNWWFGNLGMFLGLITGFVFLGPILALNLYSISARLERGAPNSLSLNFRDAKTQVSNALIFTVILGIVFLVWARAATMVHIFFPENTDAHWIDMAVFLGLGSGIGAIFCGIIFTASAFSLPMLLDRETDTVSAVVTSTNAVLRNKSAMFVWANIIFLCVIIGFATAYLAFVVLLPLLGHATWHAYKDTIDTNGWPERPIDDGL